MIISKSSGAEEDALCDKTCLGTINDKVYMVEELRLEANDWRVVSQVVNDRELKSEKDNSLV